MVRAERALLDELGIARLAAVAGGSLGGMQALEWAVRTRDRGGRHHSHREHARAAARRAWRGMRSRATPSPPIPTGRAGTTTAPAARRTRAWASRAWSDTSRTCRRTSLGRSSAGGCSSPTTSATSLTEPEFEVESYLRHQADSFVKRFDANTYLYTSRALSYFDLARQHGGGQLARRARATSSARTLLIAFSSDWLYPPSGSEELAAALRAAGKRRRAPRDRRAVWPRLFSAGGGAPDADDPEVSRQAVSIESRAEALTWKSRARVWI